MANSADPDQLASSEANWSGSTLFAKAGYIRIQQDKGKFLFLTCYVQRISISNKVNSCFLTSRLYLYF